MWEESLRKGEKIKKLNLIPICYPIRSLHYCCPSLICQLPNQSKRSRCTQTRTNGLSHGICLFIHRVHWNMKTAALNWFSVRAQTVKEKRFHATPECILTWKYFNAHKDYTGIFVRPGKYWIIMVILIRVSDNTLKCFACWKLSFYRAEAQV